ncbi:heterocyst frequency control protein PatD [Leptodesmis sichuanensis]|uniref:heterocyst frequency control protein PatD n=1 Tax=Leptodesmis sichuanensis TaxID=2906798 RepID=UPI001F44FB8F|nr:heterocyst frequency control protein PatD [Leptodesmis sichuanensis]UIE39146.1 heterocyst frequency control protein PatD [Leptodesmis sichuanensis A121]
MVEIPIDQLEMLPPEYQQPYQQLKQRVEDLQETLIRSTDFSTLKIAIAALQTFFQTEIWNLSLQNLDPNLEHQVQSINVEIDKQLRLLNMDGLFLQAARQENTVKQRKQQASDRLLLLIQYCNGLLGRQ